MSTETTTPITDLAHHHSPPSFHAWANALATHAAAMTPTSYPCLPTVPAPSVGPKVSTGDGSALMHHRTEIGTTYLNASPNSHAHPATPNLPTNATKNPIMKIAAMSTPSHITPLRTL